MNNRRTFLVNASAALAGVFTGSFASSALAKAMAPMRRGRVKPYTDDSGELHGPGKIPEVMCETSDGKRVRFYADLVQGKVVLINFTSIGNEAKLPVTAKMLEIAKRLGPKLGTEVHIISVTNDPDHDTPARLRAFRKRAGAPARGWTFIRLSARNSMIVTARLHRHPMQPMPSTRVSVISYGNEPVGLWGMFPHAISIDDAMLRIASILPGRSPAGAPHRAGPRPLGAPGLSFNSRIA